MSNEFFRPSFTPREAPVSPPSTSHPSRVFLATSQALLTQGHNPDAFERGVMNSRRRGCTLFTLARIVGSGSPLSHAAMSLGFFTRLRHEPFACLFECRALDSATFHPFKARAVIVSGHPGYKIAKRFAKHFRNPLAFNISYFSVVGARMLQNSTNWRTSTRKFIQKKLILTPFREK